jgi:DNA invertase Pin-like site-specific DNA recombinase
VSRAAIYLRVSRPDEAQIMENQRVAALEHAAKMGFSPERIHVYDETASGGDEERAGLGLMLRSLRPGDLVIFTSLSRMTRGGVGAALDILRQIERSGAGWHFVEQEMLNWDSKSPKIVKDILLGVFAAIDEDYRRRISEKTRSALARKKAAGWRGKGRRPGAKDRQPRRRHVFTPPPPSQPPKAQITQ